MQEYNSIMRRKLIARNAKDYSKKYGSRTSIFELEEKSTLLSLPTVKFHSYDEKEATVWRDFHIQYDSAFYSVPIEYIGHKVTVKATNDTVRVYDGNKLIAEHTRAVRKWQRSTLSEHIPGKGMNLHGAYSSEELLNWARKFGPYTTDWVEKELGRFEFEVQSYRPITSVLRVFNRYESAVVEKVSEIAIASSVFTVKGVKSILSAQSKLHPSTASKLDLNNIFCAHEEEDLDDGNF